MAASPKTVSSSTCIFPPASEATILFNCTKSLKRSSNDGLDVRTSLFPLLNFAVSSFPNIDSITSPFAIISVVHSKPPSGLNLYVKFLQYPTRAS